MTIHTFVPLYVYIRIHFQLKDLYMYNAANRCIAEKIA